MTVADLIKELEKLDPTLNVFVKGYEGGYNDARIGDVRDVALNVHSEWYYGKHEDWEIAKAGSIGEQYTLVKGVVL